MVSVATASARCFFTSLSVSDLNPSPSIVVFLPPNRPRFASRALRPRKLGGSSFLGQSGFWVCGFSSRCKGDWDRDEDSELEEEILEFMAGSGAFPSKKQLIEAGRADLVMAISERGGWLAMGWDLEEDDGDSGIHWNGDIGDWDYRVSEDCGNGVLRMGDGDGVDDGRCGLECDEVGVSGFDAKALHSVSSSSTDRSLETTNEDDSGIEGILKRLEKERNIKFGLGSSGKGNNQGIQNDDSEHEWHEKVAGLKRSNRANKNDDHSVQAFTQSRSVSNFDGLRNSLEPAWKTWSIQRAASSNKEFEASEIPLDESRTGQTAEDTNEEFWGLTEVSRESSDTWKKPNHNHIQNRLKSLELELSSALGSLRSKADVVVPLEGHQKSSEELRKLSDAGEFQENEIMNAQDKLRSIRAKLAVLEGKMALAIIDAQKVVDVKQRRIDDARKALRLLRTAFIVWTNPATEVLVVGSYDGWATKRKMEKSSAGIFSLYLKLYPGRYEIKFIVDGEWKIDPLRPIVNDGGHENNLLIIT